MTPKRSSAGASYQCLPGARDSRVNTAGLDVLWHPTMSVLARARTRAVSSPAGVAAGSERAELRTAIGACDDDPLASNLSCRAEGGPIGCRALRTRGDPAGESYCTRSCRISRGDERCTRRRGHPLGRVGSLPLTDGVGDEAAPRQPVAPAVLSSRQAVSAPYMQPEVLEATAALVAQQAVVGPVDDAVSAKTIPVAEPHRQSLSERPSRWYVPATSTQRQRWSNSHARLLKSRV